MSGFARPALTRCSGCVYAPNATLTLRGTNSVAASIVGSFVGSKVRISGHIALHYDERLRTSGPYEVLRLRLRSERYADVERHEFCRSFHRRLLCREQVKD